MNEIVNNIINDIEPISSLTKGIIQFNDFDLTDLCGTGKTDGYMIKTGNELSLDNVIVEEYVSEIIDGGTIIDKRYGNKGLPFTLFIQGTSHADLITKIQSLKQNLNGKNGDLFITRAGVVYKFTATNVNVVIPDFKTVEDFVDDVQLNFTLTSPHGSLEEPEVVNSIETADFERIVTNAGTYKSYPKIILIGKAGSTITDVDIENRLVSEVSGESVTVTASVGENDVLELDYLNKIVTLNGVEQKWSGFMLPLQVGNNVLDFTFTGTVNLDVIILYNKVFL